MQRIVPVALPVLFDPSSSSLLVLVGEHGSLSSHTVCLDQPLAVHIGGKAPTHESSSCEASQFDIIPPCRLICGTFFSSSHCLFREGSTSCVRICLSFFLNIGRETAVAFPRCLRRQNDAPQATGMSSRSSEHSGHYFSFRAMRRNRQETLFTAINRARPGKQVLKSGHAEDQEQE